MILSLLIILMMGILGTISYYTYLSYQKYITVQNSTEVPLFVEHVESVLDKIINERMQSAAYLVTHTKDDFTKLKESRINTDHDLLELDTFIKQYNQFTFYSKSIQHSTEALELVRRNVDDLHDSYRDIFLHAY
ncbi:hypothetical protein, partial [Sulfurovum sp.]|uniref:hypothetical protein n=1 Tax=Sulfurovum sp. TaxID=1969726 RepID=UPI0035628EA4